MKIKKGDFIELDFVGRIKETDRIFDLTKEEDAKKNNLHNPKQTYKPLVICVGENEIIKGLDEKLIGKETKKSYKIEISPEQGFGKKNQKLIKLIPSNKFKQQKINPFPGLQINIDGMMGIVRAVSGGRIIIDFNHPLAGRNLVYDITINRIVTNDKEKIQTIIKTEAKIDIKNKEVKIHLTVPEKIQEIIKKQIKKHCKTIKKVSFVKTPLKNN